MQQAPIQANWQAALANEPLRACFEFPLYSDVTFVDEVRSNPCFFLNTLARDAPLGRVQASMMVRLFVHSDLNSYHPYPSPTNTATFHGGWITDEVAALASLALGVRLWAGDESRRFDGHDDLGQPQAQRTPEPVLHLDSARLVLPDLIAKGDLGGLKVRFPTLAHLNPEDCIALVRSARLYQDALWIAESEPNLAWLMLVSALENAANRWRKKSGSPLDNLRHAMPELVKRLEDTGDEALLKFSAKRLSHLVGSGSKFVDFVLTHQPQPPSKRPSAAAGRIDWSQDGLREVLKVVYNYRSKALHGGTPFPAPMCSPTSLLQDGDHPVEIGSLGLAVNTLGGYWRAEDLPVSLHTFHYIARQTLLNWWDSLVQTPRAAVDRAGEACNSGHEPDASAPVQAGEEA